MIVEVGLVSLHKVMVFYPEILRNQKECWLYWGQRFQNVIEDQYSFRADTSSLYQ